MTLLKVSNLEVDFVEKGTVINSPLRGINLEIATGETLGIVGETGCGKTLTATAIMGLLPKNTQIRGEIEFAKFGKVSSNEISEMRGSEITMIFQNPQSSFNPIFTIGAQLRMVAQRRGIKDSEIRALLKTRLKSVGLDDYTRVLASYPHELSGGMLQRCMIAMAILGSPKLLIADEPITALDATIGHQVLALIKKLQKEEGFAMIFISHDVSAVAKVSDEISVIYGGRVVENGPTEKVITTPMHPYTKGLLGSIPSANKKRGTLNSIKGTVPSNLKDITGCTFRTRCDYANLECEKSPEYRLIDARQVACWRAPL